MAFASWLWGTQIYESWKLYNFFFCFSCCIGLCCCNWPATVGLITVAWWFVVFSLKSPLTSSYHSGASDLSYSRSHSQDSGIFSMLNMCSTFDLHRESRKLCICTNQLHSMHRGSPSESTKNKNLNSISAHLPVYSFEEYGIVRSIFLLKSANITNKTMHEYMATNMATLISDFVTLCKLKSFVSHHQARSCLSFDIPVQYEKYSWAVILNHIFFLFFPEVMSAEKTKELLIA